jgi:glycosyltransferase involved in cell wall biosynthesis
MPDLTAARVLESVEWTGGPAPRVVLYTPAIRGNPIQDMLYSQLWDRGIAPIGVHDHEHLEAAVAAVEVGGQAAIHLHWTNLIVPIEGTRELLEDNAQRFLDRIFAMKQMGVRFVWTIHNPLPHDARFPHVHLEFSRRLAEAADLIHLWSEHAIDEITPFYELPLERVVAVPHPSYIGVYPDYADQPTCRQRLELGPDDLVIAVVGAIRPYKQLDRLYAAFNQAARVSPERLRLVVGGEPGHDRQVVELLAMLRSDPAVTVVARRLSDRMMSDIVLAADVVACTYDSPIASGASMLALSLGRPVVVPDRKVSAELVGDAGIVVDLEQPGALTDRLTGLRRDDLAPMRRVARQRAEAFPIDKSAAAFADAIERVWTDTHDPQTRPR